MQGVHEGVEAAAMRHADDDLLHAELAAALKQQIAAAEQKAGRPLQLVFYVSTPPTVQVFAHPRHTVFCAAMRVVAKGHQ